MDAPVGTVHFPKSKIEDIAIEQLQPALCTDLPRGKKCVNKLFDFRILLYRQVSLKQFPECLRSPRTCHPSPM
jgi:hypothetical protein